MKEAIDRFLSPWRRRREVAALAEELRRTKLRLENTIAMLKAAAQAIETLYLHQLGGQANLAKFTIVLENIWQRVTGEDLVPSASESISDPKKIAADVAELQRWFELGEPPKGDSR
jgi:hypothetical protein